MSLALHTAPLHRPRTTSCRLRCGNMSAFVAPAMCATSGGGTPPSEDNVSRAPSPPSSAPPAPSSYLSDVSASLDEDGGLRPRYRRSKLLLTRRVYSLHVARTRANRSGRSAAPPSRSIPPAPAQIDAQIAPPFAPATTTHFRPEYYLEDAPPVPAYFFLRGLVPFPSRRRSGDPPSRYLELHFGMVEPDSPLAGDCANPRASRQIKRWYANAIRWRVLHKDFRPVMSLSEDRLVAGPAKRPWPEDGSAGVVKSDRNSILSTLWAPAWSKQEPAGTMAPEPLPQTPLLVHEGTHVARALARSPRVIVIGDVHGCVDEFQALLRLSDYQPGDQVILLGDLVAKGPDSVGVVQMARDLGARTVRGEFISHLQHKASAFLCWHCDSARGPLTYLLTYFLCPLVFSRSTTKVTTTTVCALSLASRAFFYLSLKALSSFLMCAFTPVLLTLVTILCGACVSQR